MDGSEDGILRKDSSYESDSSSSTEDELWEENEDDDWAKNNKALYYS